MPGLDFYTYTKETVAVAPPQEEVPVKDAVVETAELASDEEESIPAPSNGHVNGDSEPPRDPNVYYNARLDPKNFLEGPLSHDPCTRLRQMLARPGIVVRTSYLWPHWKHCLNFWGNLRLLPAFVMVSAPVVHSKPASIACTKGNILCIRSWHHLILESSGAATTASRLGQPDLAIATLNDFVQVNDHIPIPSLPLVNNSRSQSAQMVCSLSPVTPVIADADTGLVASSL